MILPYGLAVACTGLLLYKGGAGHVSVMESTKYIKQIEVKEVVKYVEVNRTDNRRVEVTKPDGTRIVSTSNSTTDRREQVQARVETKTEVKEKETTKVNAKPNYNLGITYDTAGSIGVSGGIRLGTLPLFLQLYAVPSRMSGAIGLQLEL
jgi:hypothetical protein